MRREIHSSTLFAAAPKATVVLTFESAAEEESFIKALALVDGMTGPSADVAALTRDELAATINSAPMDSVDDMVRWEIARREWMCRESEWVGLYKERDPGCLVPIRQRQKSLDIEWLQRAREAKNEGG